MKLIDFKVVRHFDRYQFERDCLNLINNGYLIHGQLVCCFDDKDGVTYMYQAFSLYKDE